MSKPISKVAVRCPHCAAEQPEPELAKSTFCRTCSQYFSIGPATLASARRASVAENRPRYGAGSSDREPLNEAPRAEDKTSAAGGLLQKLDGFFGKPRTRTAECFECSSDQEVSASALSSTCRACGAYIDLQDYKINGSFSRNIQTRGSVVLNPKGDLSSSKVICSEAQIYDKMRGNMQCRGKVTVKFQGRLAGSLEAGELLIERGSEIIFSRPVKAAAVTIVGKVTAQIISGSHVSIHKTGALEGAVVATGFNVERGGCFQGELTITPRGQAAEANTDGSIPVSSVSRTTKLPGDLDAFLAGDQTPLLG